MAIRGDLLCYLLATWFQCPDSNLRGDNGSRFLDRLKARNRSSFHRWLRCIAWRLECFAHGRSQTSRLYVITCQYLSRDTWPLCAKVTMSESLVAHTFSRIVGKPAWRIPYWPGADRVDDRRHCPRCLGSAREVRAILAATAKCSSGFHWFCSGGLPEPAGVAYLLIPV